MKPSELIETLLCAISEHIPVHIWGSSGVGKSAIGRSVATILKRQFADLRAVLLDPVDLRGLPTVSGDKTHWVIPEFLPRDGEGVLLIDELPSAPQMVQASFYQLILDRRIGEYVLPDGWDVIAAGNRASDRGVHFAMPRPLRNRFKHVTLEPDLKEWCSWAVVSHIHPAIIAFLRLRPNLLLDEEDKDAFSWPTPRSWEMASKTLKAWMARHNNSVTDTLLMSQLSGDVGEGAASELMASLRLYSELPSPEEIVLNPKSAPVPDEASAAIAVATSLGRFMNDQNIVQIDQYLARMTPEYGVMAMRDASKRDRMITKTPTFVNFNIRHQQLVA